MGKVWKTPEQWADHIMTLTTPRVIWKEIVHAIDFSVKEALDTAATAVYDAPRPLSEE